MSTRAAVVVLVVSFSLTVVGAIAGGYLESAGILTRERLGRSGVVAVVSVFFLLFLVMAFAAVPLGLRAFLSMQTRVGNGEVPLIAWMLAHERSITYGVWGLFAAGLGIALVLARVHIFEQLRQL